MYEKETRLRWIACGAIGERETRRDDGGVCLHGDGVDSEQRTDESVV